MKTALVCCGGGGRGILGAYLLKEVGIDLFNKFDFYAGTSVGSINILSLLTRQDPDLLCRFYDVNLGKIFNTGWIRNLISASKYDGKALNSALQDAIVGRFGDVGKPVFAASHDLSTRNRRLWWNDGEDGKINAWEIARSSAAAHTYFPPFKEGGEWYADGGVFANDPTMPMLSRIVGKYGVSSDEIKIFVIGTGYNHEFVRTDLPPSKIWDWLPILREDTVTNVVDVREDARYLLGGDRYYLADFDIGKNDIAMDDVDACKKLPLQCADQIKFHADKMRAFLA